MLGMIGGCQQSSGESSEEELAVLPPHTKVVVTGNNRTKSVLVGLQGVVKKAVGLGGWHWLNSRNILNFSLESHYKQKSRLLTLFKVLANGIEVKLQRNALSVIEAPTGHDGDHVNGCNNMKWNDSNTVSDDTQSRKLHKSRVRHQKGSCNKSLSRSFSCDLHSKGSVSSSRSSRSITKVDLSKLETRALRRYWRHFNLVDAIPNPSKEQLIDIIQRHFLSQKLDELQVIMGFVQAAKRLKTETDTA